MRRIAFILLVASPLLTAWLILRYGVNVPVWDQLDIGQFLVRNHDRLFPNLADLFAQHNESRKFFPRILFFYLARATHWNVKAEMAVSFLMACGVAANIFVLSGKRIVETAIATMLIFSPVQWWNWLFGIQVVVFVPILMLTTALVVLRTISTPRVIIAALLCIVATFSYANGMLLWLVLIIPLWKRWRLLAFWCVTAAATIALYFYDYHRPPGHPALASPLSHPIEFLTYVLAFLGHPLSWMTRSVSVAVIIGAIAVAGFVFLARRGGAASSIGLYAILSACATAVGRLGLSLPQSLEPRYATFSIYLMVAIVLMMPVRRVLWIFVVLHVLAVRTIWPEMLQGHRERLIARTAEQFALVAPDYRALREFVFPDVKVVAIVNALDGIGYINPRPVRSDVVTQLRRDESPRHGTIERIAPAANGEAAISGSASLPVLITRDGEHVIAISTQMSEDHWVAFVPQNVMRPGTILHAWSYDSATQTAYRLSGEIRSE